MILLIIFGALLFVGILLLVDNEFSLLGLLLTVVGGIFLLIFVTIAIVMPLDYKKEVIAYHQYKAQLEEVATNRQTDHFNSLILYHKAYRKNAFIGLFFSKELSELELIPYINGQKIDNPVQVYLKEE